MAYGDIKVINGVKYKDVTPNMTGMNTPAPYVVTARSSGSVYLGEPWMLFNGKGDTHVAWTTADSIVTLDFGQCVDVDYVELHTGNDVATRGVTMAGSNDNANFTTLCSVRSYATVGEKIHPDQMIVLPERASYRYFKFTSFPSHDWCHYDQFRLYQKVAGEYFIIKDNVAYKTIADGNLVELTETVISKALFETKGFTDINQILPVQSELSASFDILRYDTTAANSAIKINHLPTPQLIIPKDDISTADFDTISKVELVTTGTTGTAKAVVSFDKGATWKSYKDSVWTDCTLTADAVGSNGMTAAELAAIPAAKWADVKSDTIRFAYYLAKTAVTDDLAIDALTITGNVNGIWKKAQHMADYDYGYSDNQTLQVKLLADGSYKINYAEVK